MDVNNLKHVVGSYEQGKPAVIRFFGPVDYWTVNEFNEEFLWLQEWVKPSKIIVAINSEGGSVIYGMSTFSLINSCPIETECVIEGIAASMGSIIWAAGKRLYMHDYSLLMIHNPFIEDASDDENTKRSIEVFRKQIETIYVKRFGLSEDQVKDIMDGKENLDGTFFSAQEAVDAGIIPDSHVIETERAVTDKIGDVMAEAKEGGKDVQVREMFTSIAAEISNEKLIAKLETITNKKQPQKQHLMNEKDFKEIVAQLGLKEDATMIAVSAKVGELLKAKNELAALQAKHSELEIKFTGKETEVSNLKGELATAKAELQKYKDAEAAALKAEIESVVDAAVAAGKITAEAKESWIQMAQNNFDTVKATLASIEGRKVISEVIAKDPKNQEQARNGMTEAEQQMQAKVTEVVGENFELKKF
jgi:ATP-dependent protease ClpP protease subunit